MTYALDATSSIDINLNKHSHYFPPRAGGLGPSHMRTTVVQSYYHHDHPRQRGVTSAMTSLGRPLA
eukprot:9128122-Pyramimonas_sp.AAC.1